MELRAEKWVRWSQPALNFDCERGNLTILVKAQVAYGASLAIVLLVFYFRERANAGPLPPRAILIMIQIAAFLALVPAAAYVLFSELLRRGR